MYWNLGIEPKVVKVFPDVDLLLDKLSPLGREQCKIRVRN